MPTAPKTSVGVDSIQRLLRRGASKNALNLLQKQHPADLAEVLRALPDRDRLDAFDLVLEASPALALEAMTELDPPIGASLLADRPAEEIARLVQELSPDDAATIVGRLPATIAPRVLGLMRRPAAVRALLEHEQQTAGRIMNPDVFALSEEDTAGDAVAALQRARGLEMVFYLYVVDARRHLVGVTSLRRLLLVPPETPLERIMTTELVSVREDTDQEEVARIVASYNLLAVPVVDHDNRLVGFITVDDVIDVMKDETTEDIHKIGGLEALEEPYTRTPFWSLIKKRGRWLAVLFVGQLLTATAMGYFEAEIAQAVVLALFVPVIISSGGNSGSQAASLIIRAMAVGEVTPGDWWRVMRREVLSGLVLGAILAALGFVRIGAWEHIFGVYGVHWFLLSLTVSFSLVGVVLWGTIAGSMLPFVMRRIGADPAASSAPLVATLVDVTGLVIYFSIAVVLLRGTLL